MMKIRFTATCEINPDGKISLSEDIQRRLEQALMLYHEKCESNQTVDDLWVETANEIPEEHSEKISGETCPICGFNGDMKITGLTDEEMALFCPQCKSYFKVKICPEDDR